VNELTYTTLSLKLLRQASVADLMDRLSIAATARPFYLCLAFTSFLLVAIEHSEKKGKSTCCPVDVEIFIFPSSSIVTQRFFESTLYGPGFASVYSYHKAVTAATKGLCPSGSITFRGAIDTYRQ
jgi:hypothetical protein